MGTSLAASISLDALLGMLADKDGMVRQKAREALVIQGKPAVQPLISALQTSKSDQVRWEAAKALGAIGDTRSIPSLVEALTDSDTDVEWLAAVALSKFGKAAWPALLQALIRDSDSYASLSQGAHHVFSNQSEDGFNDLLAELLKSLDTNGLPETAIVTARNILKLLKL
jgi:HEAT repeat protein